MNALDFTGKTVLVVGGSGGIGNAVAQAFRVHGATVHVWGTRASASNYTSDEYTDLTGLQYAHVDVSDFDALEAYQPPFDALDVLVTCQGLVLYGRQEFQISTFRKVVDVNLTSVMACCMKFEPMLKKRPGGCAVIFGSLAGIHTSLGNPAYSASKAATHQLVRTLGETWCKHGLRINGIAPGLVATRMTEIATKVPERLSAQLNLIPMRRVGKPSEMAGPALFLASDLASYMTGQILLVDGGRRLP